jgi:carbamate kinase
MPLDVCGADSQGGIGYMMQQSLQNELHRIGLNRAVVTIVTQVIVDERDPAFRRPTKPIGPFYTQERARTLAKEKGWTVVEDAGRGYRRVVPSPKPLEIVEIGAIRKLVAEGTIVIAVGGGGIPVSRQWDGTLHGVEAVIDKDLASSLLARTLEADILVLPTGVEKVALDFNKPTQRWLDRMTIAQARKHQADDQFDKGSMGPKIAALIDFVAGGGRMGLITDPPNLARALKGETGTRLVK